MSNWMTSGSARLKAAQKNSFSRRAKKRALVVVAHNDPLMKENAATRRFPQPQPGRKSGTIYRLVFCFECSDAYCIDWFIGVCIGSRRKALL